MKNKEHISKKLVDGHWVHRVIVDDSIYRITEPKIRVKDENCLPNATGEFSFGNYSDVQVNGENFRKMSRKINANRLVAEYYEKYYKDLGISCEKPKNVSSCFKVFDLDVYKQQRVKDIKRTNLCRNKFCINCQSQLSERRYEKFRPILEELSKDYSIYHMVFTVPNCSDAMLKFTLEKMNKKFAHLIRYFQCSKKIKGLDFSQYGFYGAVKCLEIVIHEKGFLSEFHPHFHCLFVLDKNFKEVGSHINTYSFSKSEIKSDSHIKDGKRFFSDFEILLQKIWYLLFNDKKVTKENIENLDLGYSCFAQRIISDYKEVFKYCMKGLFDPLTSRFMYSYQTFVTLYEAIYRKKIIQGYGELNKYKFLLDDDLDVEDKLDAYNKIVVGLRLNEEPELVHSTLSEVVSDMETKKYYYISKKSILTRASKVQEKL